MSNLTIAEELGGYGEAVHAASATALTSVRTSSTSEASGQQLSQSAE